MQDRGRTLIKYSTVLLFYVVVSHTMTLFEFNTFYAEKNPTMCLSTRNSFILCTTI